MASKKIIIKITNEKKVSFNRNSYQSKEEKKIEILSEERERILTKEKVIDFGMYLTMLIMENWAG